MQRVTWWRCGLLGLIVLLATTVIGAPAKVSAYIAQHGPTDFTWQEALLFLLCIAGMGFACGVVGWFIWLLTRRLGAIGDATTGVFIAVFYFFLCMVIFDRSLLIPDSSKGLPMWMLAVVVGIILGVWCGRDIRHWAKEQMAAEQKREQVEQRLPAARKDELPDA